jgi:hypothetical protein
MTDEQKKGWVAPDWYRTESDEEFRNPLLAGPDAET